MASMPVPRIVLDKLIEALAIVALGSSSSITMSALSQMEEFTVELVNKGLCSSSEAPISENTDNAGVEDIDEVSVCSMIDL
jgi:hypothetical protein